MRVHSLRKKDYLPCQRTKIQFLQDIFGQNCVKTGFCLQSNTVRVYSCRQTPFFLVLAQKSSCKKELVVG